MCGIIGVIDKRRQCMDGSSIRNSLAMMDERGNGEGAGYVAYGIYPDFADVYALHVFFDRVQENKPALDRELAKWGTIVHDEEIPTLCFKNKKSPHPVAVFFQTRPEDDTGTGYSRR
jgi:glutamate synthase domain-containing protein 1